MTRRTINAIPLLAFASDPPTPLETFINEANVWLRLINQRMSSDAGPYEYNIAEVRAWKHVRDAWPELKRSADKYYGL